MDQQRFLGLFVMIFTIAATLLLLALFEREAEGNIPFDCMDPTERERVRDIALHGIDQGLEEATRHLYSVWQKDPNTEQPKRARVGIVNAINAHARARKFALDWTPPTCPPTEK